MKRLFIFIFLLLSFPSWGAITVVQHTCSNPANGSTAPTLAFPSNVTAGNELAVWYEVSTTNAANPITSVTDTLGNTYTRDAHNVSASIAMSSQGAQVENISSGGADTITVNNPGWVAQALCIFELSGMASSSSFDVNIPLGSDTVPTGTVTSGTYSTATANEIALAVCYDQNFSSPAFVAGTGFTSLDSGGSSAIFLSERQIYSSPQSGVNATCTDSGAGSAQIAGMVLKGAAATVAHGFPVVE